MSYRIGDRMPLPLIHDINSGTLRHHAASTRTCDARAGNVVGVPVAHAPEWLCPVLLVRDALPFIVTPLPAAEPTTIATDEGRGVVMATIAHEIGRYACQQS